MNPSSPESSALLTGRIRQSPATVVVDEILRPQFDYERVHVLSCYVLIEQALLAEYVRLELMSLADAQRIAHALAKITPATIEAHAATSMTDIAFSIEALVGHHVQPAVPIWHVDRSRNDLQACAQLMALRQHGLAIVNELIDLCDAAHALASRTTTIPMPGFTHYQAAEIISPGYYLSGLIEQVLQAATALLDAYDRINASPLAAGALAGQHLAWDRTHLAQLLGFDRPQRNALVSVASREGALRLSAELAVLGTTLSRFVTDLLVWGGSQYGFIDLPDQLSGISSAMPQKKNFPLLERIRGRTAHMTGLFVDLALGQRNTPFTNLVEVSKEASANLIHQLTSTHSTIRLFTLVLEHLEFRPDRLRAACDKEFFGGFQLANILALNYEIPYRKAQVIAGKFIVALIDQQLPPKAADPSILSAICAANGYTVAMDEDYLRSIFDTEPQLWSKQSRDSTHPHAVAELLHEQAQRATDLRSRHQDRQQRLDAVPKLIAKTLKLPT